MPKNHVRSANRFHAREAMDKFTPAIKALSSHLHKTASDAPKDIFFGYEVPAGTLTDAKGVVWQFQVRAICAKKDFIKSNAVEPIINKWAIGFRVRMFLKMIIDKLFE